MNRIILLSALALLAINTKAETNKDAPDPYLLNGNVKEVKSNYGNSTANYVISVDHDNGIIVLTSYDKDGKLYASTTLQKDEAGTINETEKYFAHNDHKAVYTYKFENGKKTLQSVNYNGKESIKKAYKYYDNGRLQQVISYDINGGVTDVGTYSYAFDKNETTVTQTDGEGNLQSTRTYTYDEHNNPVNVKVLSHAWEQEWNLSYTYVYDEQGNYTAYTLYKDGQPTTTIKREIIYM